MSEQVSTQPRAARRALALAACLVLVLIVHAQDAPPPPPAHDFDQSPAYPVVQVTARCRVSVRCDGGEQTFVLAGVTIPPHEPARARLRQFLEQLLVDEEVYIRPESAIPDPLPAKSTPQADLFRAPDGLFANLEVVRQGYAKVRAAPPGEHLELLRHYEQRARKAKKGVWAPRSRDNQKPRASTPKPANAGSSPKTDPITVYVTKSGEKYHRKDCQHLRKSSRAVSLTEALEKKYEPCSRCKPPTRENP